MLDDTKVETQKLQLEETDLRLKNSELRLEYSENVDKLTDKQKETEAAQKEADKWMMISDTAKWSFPPTTAWPLRPACSARPPRMACTTHWTLAASGCRRQTRPAERHKKGPSPAEETVLFVVLYSSVTSKSRGLPQPGHLGAPSSRSSSSNTVV